MRWISFLVNFLAHHVHVTFSCKLIAMMLLTRGEFHPALDLADLAINEYSTRNCFQVTQETELQYE